MEKRRLWRIFVLLGTVLIMLAVATPPATAHGDQGAKNAHSGNDSGSSTSHAWSWPTDGCSHVPDSARGVFYFNHPCDHHDGCYGNHWQSRWGCDNTFKSNMTSACKHNWAWWNPARKLCYGVRTTYYKGVRALGYPAYNGWSISGPSGW